MLKYILDGKTPILEPDILKWAQWFEAAGDERVVRQTAISKEVSVSTVFLGLDESFGLGPTQLFETMIFGGDRNGEHRRYATWGEAVEGHNAIVALFAQTE